MGVIQKHLEHHLKTIDIDKITNNQLKSQLYSEHFTSYHNAFNTIKHPQLFHSKLSQVLGNDLIGGEKCQTQSEHLVDFIMNHNNNRNKSITHKSINLRQAYLELQPNA